MSKRNGKEEGKSSQGKIIQIDEEQIKGHLDVIIRGTVEEMLFAITSYPNPQMLLVILAYGHIINFPEVVVSSGLCLLYYTENQSYEEI